MRRQLCFCRTPNVAHQRSWLNDRFLKFSAILNSLKSSDFAFLSEKQDASVTSLADGSASVQEIPSTNAEPTEPVPVAFLKPDPVECRIYTNQALKCFERGPVKHDSEKNEEITQKSTAADSEKKMFSCFSLLLSITAHSHAISPLVSLSFLTGRVQNFKVC